MGPESLAGTLPIALPTARNLTSQAPMYWAMIFLRVTEAFLSFKVASLPECGAFLTRTVNKTQLIPGTSTTTEENSTFMDTYQILRSRQSLAF